MTAFLCLLFATVGGYFAFRYFALKRALRDMNRDLQDIRKDIARNQILHLPLPDRTLEQVMKSVNETLEETRRQRLLYEERENEFQKQIENISHDLRTPLTVILGYLKWMKRDAAQQDAAQKTAQEILSHQMESLEILERNARAMERLVSQFYAFSQLNAQDYTLELQAVDVCRLLKESLAENWPMLEKARLRLESSLPEHPVMVRGNKDALERIFANMFQNTERYAHSYLSLCMEETEDGQVSILFQNDSEKIQEDAIPHIFERFYQNSNARNHGGSGLGLTIAKSLAELMGGSLQARIVPDKQMQASDPDSTTSDSFAPGRETSLHGSSLPDNGIFDSDNSTQRHAACCSSPQHEKPHILFILTLISAPCTCTYGAIQACPPEPESLKP